MFLCGLGAKRDTGTGSSVFFLMKDGEPKKESGGKGRGRRVDRWINEVNDQQDWISAFIENM